MKKLLVVTVLFFAGLFSANAQNDTIIYDVTQVGYNSIIILCDKQYDRLLLYVPEGYSSFHWTVNGENSYDNPLILDSQTNSAFLVEGRPFNFKCRVYFIHVDLQETMVATVWKHKDESIEISLDTLPEPNFGTYSFLWSNGDTSPSIQVHECGAYYCNITHHVGSTTSCFDATYTFIVQDNVEIYRSTVDLETNLNKVTWQVTEEQAEYINQVKVERDGFVVGTAPYTDGFFLDNIGSENAARNYRLTAIDTDGNECPIPSYQKGTLHVDYSQNASNPNKLNMAWTPPFIEEGAPISVTYFQICKYDPATQEVTVIDQLGANNTIGSYDYNLFDGGYATVAALFSDAKEYENVSFSNLTDEILGVGEVWEAPFRVYPNPSNGKITVEGNGHLSVKNVLGQEIMTEDIEGLINLELSKGIYFLKMSGKTQKLVVE